MKLSQPVILRTLFAVRSTLSEYHPLLVEGHTRDDRNPVLVAQQIVNNLNLSFSERNITKPILLISQGDPLTEKGISAITRNVADILDVKRCLITLDSEIDPTHSELADREGVKYELKYSLLSSVLESSVLEKLEEAIDEKINVKNKKRQDLGKGNLADWYRTYALLQEASKTALKTISGEVTVAHATDEIQEFSVTSFYEVGRNLDLIDENDMVKY